jgi:hypothetical protein
MPEIPFPQAYSAVLAELRTRWAASNQPSCATAGKKQSSRRPE